MEKKEKPTQEDIDRVHQQYIEALQKLFDENKEKYAKEHPQMKMEIVWECDCAMIPIPWPNYETLSLIFVQIMDALIHELPWLIY